MSGRKLQSLAEFAGFDTTVCEICERRLDNSEPWKRGLDGNGAHLDCLARYLGEAWLRRQERTR